MTGSFKLDVICITSCVAFLIFLLLSSSLDVAISSWFIQTHTGTDSFRCCAGLVVGLGRVVTDPGVGSSETICEMGWGGSSLCHSVWGLVSPSFLINIVVTTNQQPVS